MNRNRDQHYDDEDLILYYYGESDRAAAIDDHLRGCDACTAEYHGLVATLRSVTAPDVPVRDERYGLEVWQRIRHRLPDRRPLWRRLWAGSGRGWLQAAALAASLLIVGFIAGRGWPRQADRLPPSATVSSGASSGASATATTEASRRRVLLLSVAEHFEESDRVLTELMNAPEGRNLAAEQQWAEELLSANRIYRHDAADADELVVAATLDELERALLEIVHAPSAATVAELETLERRIDSAALLFKVRVLRDELRSRERPTPVDRRPAISKAS